MWFEVNTYRPGPMAYSVKLFLEEQGVLKILELPFDAHCAPDPNKPVEENEEDAAEENAKENAKENDADSQEGGNTYTH